MATPLTVTQNPVLGDSVLGSRWLNPDHLFNQSVSFFNDLLGFNATNGPQIIAIYHAVVFLFSLFFLTIISYCAIRLLEIRSKERKHLLHEITEYAHFQAEREKKIHQGETVSKNEKWVKTLNYLFSQHPSDWKLAVIEADAMLESLLDQLGLSGETLGDKLQSADKDKFRGFASAWEVHTIRNKIVHEGVSFELSHHEAKRVIALYEQIFREYGFI